MTNRNEGITIYLTIGKEVKLNFDSENNLSSIRLSINKVAELFGNKVVNEESIFYVSTVALVTKSNYKTFISVVGGKQVISGDAVYEEVMIDQERTSNKRGNKNVYEQGYFEMQMTREYAREVKGDYRKVGGSEVLAHHLIQSFSPEDKVTPELAHELGRQLIDELTEGKFEYVIATHIDQEHIHNHIIFNSV